MTNLIPVPRYGDETVLILECGHSVLILATYGKLYNTIRGKVSLNGDPVAEVCWRCCEFSLVTDVIVWKP